MCIGIVRVGGKCLGIIHERGWRCFGSSGRFQRTINISSESFSSPNLAVWGCKPCHLLWDSQANLFLISPALHIHTTLPLCFILLPLLDFCHSSGLLCQCCIDFFVVVVRLKCGSNKDLKVITQAQFHLNLKKKSDFNSTFYFSFNLILKHALL